MTRRSVLRALAAASLTLSACRDGGTPDDSPPPPDPTPTPPLHSVPAWQVEARDALERAVAWLLAAQSPDGRWRSSTYGFFKDGQSLTPFVLDCLLDAPLGGITLSPAPVGRGLGAVLGLVDADGRIGFSGSAPDYPVYATGLALSCLGRLRPEGWSEAATPLISWLRSQQFSGADWRAHPALGGFPMGWSTAPTAPDAGHVDLSMTRRALEGLRAVDVAPGDPVFRLAFRFVMRARTDDGGFVYSPVEPQLNKGARIGGLETPSASYGTATCDGLLALRAVSPGDIGADHAARPEVAPALARLQAIHRVDVNPGVLGGPMEPFAAAMRGYYRAASSRVFHLFGVDGWQEELVRAVLAEETDGRWQNPSNLQKEDDPIVATAFAVRALARCLA